ncbi:MAG: hypothetical protein MR549_06060 [Lachnobacterium sp.]|nr:hypothetical protein [Lachnobacterium sp.]
MGSADCQGSSYEDAHPIEDHSEPANKIPEEIRKEIISICNKPESASMAPCEIIPALADEGVYIASESGVYVGHYLSWTT